MKLLTLIFASLLAFGAYATEPAKPAEAPKTEMKLAKKKADKEAEAKAAKEANKSQPAPKAEAPKK